MKENRLVVLLDDDLIQKYEEKCKERGVPLSTQTRMLIIEWLAKENGYE